MRVFYARAVLSVGYATPTDTTLSNQRQAGEMLERLWKQNAHHPGVAHYIIHSYDYPALAERALPAAQAYAGIAPRVPHAWIIEVGRILWVGALGGDSTR